MEGRRSHRHGIGAPALGLAFGALVLVLSLLAACGGGDGEGAAANKVRRIGLLHVGTDHIPPALKPLIQRLNELGWEVAVPPCLDAEDPLECADWTVAGRDLELIWNNLESEAAAEEQARLFVLDRVDLIVAFEDQSIRAAKAATARSRTPVVMLHADDPVQAGFVESLARPGGNLTGVQTRSRDVVAKQLELYQLLVPGLRRVLTLVDPDDPSTERRLEEYQTAAAQLPRPLELVIREAFDGEDIQRVFRSLRPGEVDGAFLLSNRLRLTHTALTLRLADRAGLPAHAHRSEWVEQENGALFSYGADLNPVGPLGARYVDAIFRGAPPSGLPVEVVTDVEFAINLKTASKLGIRIPEEMIIRANEVYR